MAKIKSIKPYTWNYTLPADSWIAPGSIFYSATDTSNKDVQLELPIWGDGSFITTGMFADSAVTTLNPIENIQAKRREEGRCVHCGEMLPMFWTGLGSCKVCDP